MHTKYCMCEDCFVKQLDKELKQLQDRVKRVQLLANTQKRWAVMHTCPMAKYIKVPNGK